MVALENEYVCVCPAIPHPMHTRNYYQSVKKVDILSIKFWRFTALWNISGRARWFEWIQQLPARLTEHHRSADQRYWQYRYCFPYRRHNLRQRIHISVGSVHFASRTYCVYGSLYDREVRINHEKCFQKSKNFRIFCQIAILWSFILVQW